MLNRIPHAFGCSRLKACYIPALILASMTLAGCLEETGGEGDARDEGASAKQAIKDDLARGVPEEFRIGMRLMDGDQMIAEAWDDCRPADHPAVTMMADANECTLILANGTLFGGNKNGLVRMLVRTPGLYFHVKPIKQDPSVNPFGERLRLRLVVWPAQGAGPMDKFRVLWKTAEENFLINAHTGVDLYREMKAEVALFSQYDSPVSVPFREIDAMPYMRSGKGSVDYSFWKRLSNKGYGLPIPLIINKPLPVPPEPGMEHKLLYVHLYTGQPGDKL